MGIKYITKEGGEIDASTVISEADTWKLPSGGEIISLAGIQKIADKENIVVKEMYMTIKPSESNKQQHGVVVWVGFKGDNDRDNWKMATGEASVLNTGKLVEKAGKKIYEEFASIDSRYRFAMAEKRAYTRAVAKLIKLYGVYVDVEALEFGKISSGDFDY